MGEKEAEGYFDLKLIPEYDGSGAQSIVEWLEKLELVCKLRGVSDVASVIPLRLTSGAFAVYLQLSEADKTSTEKVKGALLAAIAVDPYMAYEQFIGRRLKNGESPDVYLAELPRDVILWSEQQGPCLCLCGRIARGHSSVAKGWVANGVARPESNLNTSKGGREG